MSDLVIDTHFEGRYPHKLPTRLDPKNMTVEAVVYQGEGVVFRLDDKENLDFWMQFSVNKDQLKEILRRMEEEE